MVYKLLITVWDIEVLVGSPLCHIFISDVTTLETEFKDIKLYFKRNMCPTVTHIGAGVAQTV